jgi:uridine phosphorylase
MRLIPDIPPKLFTLSAVAVGYLLIDDTTSNEQNALGNWLMLVAQILCTNAFYKQVAAERNTNMENGKSTEDTVAMLQKMVDALNKEMNNINNI